MKNFPFLLFIGLLFLGACQNATPKTETPAAPVAADKVERVTLKKLWESDTTLVTCESAQYYAGDGKIYVSNIGNTPPSAKDGDGSIAQLSIDGKVLNANWVTGLNAPKGFDFADGKMYVTDIDEVVIIDMASGKIEDRIPSIDPQFCNDLSIDWNKDVYFTDTNSDLVLKLRKGEMSTLTKVEGFKPNGILVEKDRILLVSFKGGNFVAIDKQTGKSTVLASKIAGGDGIAPIKGGYLVSAWPGEIYFVPNDHGGKPAIKVLDTKEQQLNAADISTIPDRNIVLIPTFFGNKLMAYELSF